MCPDGRRARSGWSGASPGCFWSGPWWPRRIQKNVVQTDPGRRACPAFCPALYRRRFLMPQGGLRGVSRGPPGAFKKVWYRWTLTAVRAPPSVTHYIGEGALSRGGLFFEPGQESPGESKKTWCRWTRAAVRAPRSVPDYRGPPDPARAARGRPPCPAAAPAQGGPQAPAPAPGHPVDPAGIRRSPQGHKPCMPAHPGGGGRLRTTVAPPAAVPASRTPLATRRQDVRARAGARGRAA